MVYVLAIVVYSSFIYHSCNIHLLILHPFIFSNEEAENAIQNMNDADFNGRTIKGTFRFTVALSLNIIDCS
jgi:hypothetical protein